MGKNYQSEEIARLEKELKKANRKIKQYETVIERNRVSTAAKDNLGRIVEKERSKLELYMTLLLKNSPDIIVLFDDEDHIIYCTDSFYEVTGIPSLGMVKGKTFVDILEQLNEDQFLLEAKEAIANLKSKGETQEINVNITSDRYEPRKYKIQFSTMTDDEGAYLGFMAFMINTTDILQAKEEAEQANRAKGDFLATISHEIRTPMNAITGIVNMMESTQMDDTQLHYLDGIKRSSHVLLNLINDILDFSKIESGKLKLIPEYFQLPQLLSYLQSMFNLMFKNKPITFICEFDDDIPEVVYGDEKRLDQILTNILNNAYKYTDQGSVLFRVRKGVGKNLEFEITDTGIGIKEDSIPLLFGEFEQLDLVKNKKIAGTGLGLAITKYLVDEMDGIIEVESVYEEGSTFRVIIPFEVGEKKDLPRRQISVTNFDAPDAKILVVDDIEINLEIAQYMLREFSIEADIAISGKEALQMFEKNHYDVILMDHMMPEMDGIETTHKIRRQGLRGKETPIIALTANAVSSAVEMFVEEGFDGFIAKPIDRNSLAKELIQHIPKDMIILKD